MKPANPISAAVPLNYNEPVPPGTPDMEKFVNDVLSNSIFHQLDTDPALKEYKHMLPEHVRYLSGFIKSVHKNDLGLNTSNNLSSEDISKARKRFPTQLEFLMAVERVRKLDIDELKMIETLKKQGY